jgi:hypothetical protein
VSAKINGKMSGSSGEKFENGEVSRVQFTVNVPAWRNDENRFGAGGLGNSLSNIDDSTFGSYSKKFQYLMKSFVLGGRLEFDLRLSDTE